MSSPARIRSNFGLPYPCDGTSLLLYSHFAIGPDLGGNAGYPRVLFFGTRSHCQSWRIKRRVSWKWDLWITSRTTITRTLPRPRSPVCSVVLAHSSHMPSPDHTCRHSSTLPTRSAFSLPHQVYQDSPIHCRFQTKAFSGPRFRQRLSHRWSIPLPIHLPRLLEMPTVPTWFTLAIRAFCSAQKLS